MAGVEVGIKVGITFFAGYGLIKSLDKVSRWGELWHECGMQKTEYLSQRFFSTTNTGSDRDSLLTACREYWTKRIQHPSDTEFYVMALAVTLATCAIMKCIMSEGKGGRHRINAKKFN